jgi:hypothetical protein
VIANLDGWQLAAVAIVAVFVAGFILTIVVMREGRSRKVRVGMFVEREYEDGPIKRERDDWDRDDTLELPPGRRD